MGQVPELSESLLKIRLKGIWEPCQQKCQPQGQVCSNKTTYHFNFSSHGVATEEKVQEEKGAHLRPQKNCFTYKRKQVKTQENTSVGYQSEVFSTTMQQYYSGSLRMAFTCSRFHKKKAYRQLQPVYILRGLKKEGQDTVTTHRFFGYYVKIQYDNEEEES